MLECTSEFRVGGVQPLTLIDFPGKIATVLFAQGCNMRCRFCYNMSLLSPRSHSEIPWGQIVEFLADRQGFIEGVVFSGGEPCMQGEALLSAMRQVRELGFEIGLHTNGCYPEIVVKAIRQRLLHFVAVDYKAPFASYAAVAGDKVNEQAFAAMVDAIVEAGLPHEFRTTWHPDLIKESDLLVMAGWLMQHRVSNYALQKFKAGSALDSSLRALSQSWILESTVLKLKEMFSSFIVRSEAGESEQNQIKAA